eukprot:3702563-Amphidinium_carterae.1
MATCSSQGLEVLLSSARLLARSLTRRAGKGPFIVEMALINSFEMKLGRHCQQAKTYLAWDMPIGLLGVCVAKSGVK